MSDFEIYQKISDLKRENIEAKKEKLTQVRIGDMVGCVQGRPSHAKCKTSLCLEIKTLASALLQHI